MANKQRRALCVCVIALASTLAAQSFNATISGTVLDTSGAAVPGAQVTLSSLETGSVAKTESNGAGLYAFPNLLAGSYKLSISSPGFGSIVQNRITIAINQSIRFDVTLHVGIQTQTVQVSANASALNFDNAEQAHGLAPETIGELPLLGSGNIRAAVGFVVLMPGVSTGAADETTPEAARFNGGIMQGEAAVLDGGIVEDGMYQTGGIIQTIADHPLSVESISEVSVLTSNYDTQYGHTGGAVITSVTKSGTNNFHGELYEFIRNTALDAAPFGRTQAPQFIQNDFGGNIGGPIKIPGISGKGRKAFFFFNYEGLQIRGGAVQPVLSIPSLKERQGDFSDWVDANGNLIPVYDPNTTRANPQYNPNQPTGLGNLPFLRDQFMGCDGKTPNVICSSDPRLKNSLANAFFKFLPAPTFLGPLNNYLPPEAVPNISFGGNNFYDYRVDYYIGEKDHFSASDHYLRSTASSETALPKALATESDKLFSHKHLARLNWDHTFSSTVLNHFTFGYNQIDTPTTSWNQPYANQLPQIEGVAAHIYPPTINFQDFSSYGWDYSDQEKQSRPTFTYDDMLTWVRGKHTLKFGGSITSLDMNNLNRPFESGEFTFDPSTTGLLGINSGNDIASFILGAVGTGTANFFTVDTQYARQRNYGLFFGDTWKASHKLSVDYGLRWDLSLPASEKYNQMSFLNPVMPNPGAGNLPGTLAFAGSGYGSASFGAPYPEKIWYKGFAPRLGISYALTQKTVIRTGYGIFYADAFYPGWGGGIAQDGFNTTATFTTSNGGITPAFLWQNGFPQNFKTPPSYDSTFDNGQQAPNYRPFDANRLPYTQQWNLTVEHEFTSNLYVDAAYVGNKGTRLNSAVNPISALNPSLLSMGQKLFDQFQPGQTTLDGVSVPYAGWVNQMTACPPTVAQALLPFPQYCGNIYGLNENQGNSTYNSFQLKVEKRFAHGFYLLGSYTNSKLLTDSENRQATQGQGATGISPFQRWRDKAIALDDTPQSLSVASIYELPFGKGKRFVNRDGSLGKLVGGWGLTSIFRAESGTPFEFTSSECNVPPQFVATCIPALLPGVNPYAQSKGNFNPNKPLLNIAAFEPASSFNFYTGQGSRVSNIRGFGYHNHDIGLIKDTKITERVGFQFRAEAFNVWNWHIFAGTGGYGGIGLVLPDGFVNDVASPQFGMWNGTVSSPRTIQFGAKLTF
jgi:hypothetical protein